MKSIRSPTQNQSPVNTGDSHSATSNQCVQQWYDSDKSTLAHFFS